VNDCGGTIQIRSEMIVKTVCMSGAGDSGVGYCCSNPRSCCGQGVDVDVGQGVDVVGQGVDVVGQGVDVVGHGVGVLSMESGLLWFLLALE